MPATRPGESALDLRRVLGLGQIGFGFRLLLSEDAKSATLTPGLAFTRSGLRLELDEGVALTLPAGAGPFAVALRAENHDDPALRLGDEPTVIFGDTVVAVSADAPPASMRSSSGP